MKKYKISVENFLSTKDLVINNVHLVLRVKKNKKNKILKFRMAKKINGIYEIELKKISNIIKYWYVINNKIKLDNKIEVESELKPYFNLKADNKIAVLSTMSSGKSTLINALLGREVLPSENQACTGKIFEISNNKGNSNMIQALKDDEIIIENIEPEYLKNLNSDNRIDKIKINTKFQAIQKEIVLYDTPGVNNYMNDSHEKTTYEFLQKNGIKNILYIINATQIGVTDDKKFLVDLKELYENTENNIVFLLNKIDVIDSKYEEKENIVENAKEYLKNIGFKNPLLIPISAHTAKILRKGMNNNLETRREKMEYNTYVDFYLEKNKITDVEKNRDKKLIEKILNETGIKQLETLINQG